MLPMILLLVAAGMAAAEPVRIHQAAFEPGADGVPRGWTLWAPRPEIAPRGYVDTIHGRGDSNSLALAGNSNPAVFGGWVYEVPRIEPAKWYRLTAYYRAESVPYEPLQVLARLDWTGAAGKRVGWPEYASSMSPDGEWTRVSVEAPAPKDAVSLKAELYLANAPQGVLWWDDVSIEEIAAPGPRLVTVASVNFRPSETQGGADNVRRFLEVVEREVPAKADIIVLPEGITVVGSRRSYTEVSEPVPGPATAMLGEVARRRHAYIVAGIYERDGVAVYNTAVLIDRNGNVAGKYRKVYLPHGELEEGLTPGVDYPVFQTDFGRVGMMICWDLQFADPARALSLRGAELLLLPIWGGNETLGKARTIENQVFLAASGYDYPTQIIDPNGEILSSTRANGKVAVATIDLNHRYEFDWIGRLRTRWVKELRLDLKVERPVSYRAY